jgi:hypothetical protein
MPVLAALWQWRKAILWGGIVAAVALMGWRVTAWHAAYKALPKAQAALKAEVECLDGSECRAREARLQEVVGREQVRVVTAYEAELAAVRGRPPVTVRVCDRGGVPVSGPAGRGDAGTAAAGALSGPAAGDRDIGPELSALALEADEVTARCRALQQWNRALAAD